MTKLKPKQSTAFGHIGLQQVLRAMSSSSGNSQARSHNRDDVIIQVSSIATLGAKWEEEFFKILWTSTVPISGQNQPRIKILFPCVKDIRISLNGYSSGGSIHMKSQTTNMRAQNERFKKLFVCWCHDADNSGSNIPDGPQKHDALRQKAAPHIKTYIRLNSTHDSIKWALLTSANLSKQAWGEVHNRRNNQVSIASYEIGVIVWPELFGQEGRAVEMVPVFGRDDIDDPKTDILESESPEGGDSGEQGFSELDLIPLRMPYGLPINDKKPRYHDEPWTTDQEHFLADNLGYVWHPTHGVVHAPPDYD